jgi:hypothetical protein
MDKDGITNRILETEVESGGRARNVCGILTAAVYGMLGCPVCCCFCCGCGGKFPAGPMVPNDVKADVLKMPPEAQTLFNVETHFMAAVLGCNPANWCTACLCCGGCGKCGPYGTVKLGISPRDGRRGGCGHRPSGARGLS